MNSPAVDTQLAARLRLALTRSARRLRQEAGAGLSPSLSAALATIDRRGPMTPSELAGVERVTRPTATRIAARLGEQGLIERAPDPTDGRVTLLSATARGRDLLDELRSRKTAYLEARLDRLSEDDLAALDRAAHVLERMLEDER